MAIKKQTKKKQTKKKQTKKKLSIELEGLDIREYCLGQADQMIDSIAETISGVHSGAIHPEDLSADATIAEMGQFIGFTATVGVMELLDRERSIISTEWHIEMAKKHKHLAKHVERWKAEIIDETRRYLLAKKKLKESMPQDFDRIYKEVKQQENVHKIRQLQELKGRGYIFVLPTFNDDGSHEPVGEHDVPWNQIP